MLTVIKNIKNYQYNGNQSPEDGSTANLRNVVYKKYFRQLTK
jgi:hypothetical protein